MKKSIGVFLILCLLLCGCGAQEKYAFSYESDYVQLGDQPAVVDYFAKKAVNDVSAESRPLLLLNSKAEYELFCRDLETLTTKAAAAHFRAWFEKTEATFFSENVFEEWSVAVVCCQEPENVRYMIWLKTGEDAFRIEITKVLVNGNEEKQTVWLIPVWVTKMVLDRSSVMDAAVVQEISQRYPLRVQTNKGSRGCLTEGLQNQTCDVNTMGLSKVEIDFAGKVQELRTALEQGSITTDELLLRAQIDAQAGLCRRDDYNDGGTVVYTYDNYKLYRLKQLHASGKTVPGDIWITSPEITLNMIK